MKSLTVFGKLSMNPLDYGLIKMNDLEIACHSIIIDGLPKNIPYKNFMANSQIN